MRNWIWAGVGANTNAGAATCMGEEVYVYVQVMCG